MRYMVAFQQPFLRLPLLENISRFGLLTRIRSSVSMWETVNMCCPRSEVGSGPFFWARAPTPISANLLLGVVIQSMTGLFRFAKSRLINRWRKPYQPGSLLQTFKEIIMQTGLQRRVQAFTPLSTVTSRLLSPSAQQLLSWRFTWSIVYRPSAVIEFQDSGNWKDCRVVWLPPCVLIARPHTVFYGMVGCGIALIVF